VPLLARRDNGLAGEAKQPIAQMNPTSSRATAVITIGAFFRQGRLADYLTRLDFVILDELGYRPFAQAGGQLLFHLTKCFALDIPGAAEGGKATEGRLPCRCHVGGGLP
jgi:hypothetical protein